MNLEELRKFKPQIEAIAAKYGVTDIRVFGSVARGDAREDSDVDFLINLPKTASLMDLSGINIELSKTLGRKVDSLEPSSVHWYIRDSVLNEAISL